MRRIVAVAGGAAVVIGATAVAATGLLSGAAKPPATSGLPAATATVTRADIEETVDVDGAISYGTPADLVARTAGTITSIAAQASQVSRGQALYAVDAQPVFLMYGSVPFYRPLSTDATGADVAELESNLAALGYGGFTVDDRFTSNTADAVRRWQTDRGVAATGTITPSSVSVASGPVRIAAQTRKTGDQVGPGQPVLQCTSAVRAVNVPLDISDQQYARAGAAVTIDLPDHTTTAGVIASVGTAATTQSGQTTIPVAIAFRDPGRITALEGAPVTVHLVSAQRKDVLTVPVAALLALAEGGYGLQVVDGTQTRIVPVRTGLFGSGAVEVSGPGLTAGTRVGMPPS
ncbi:peptidoglycan-binding protein [Fodinicola acaciae]|uniref:peptidoglycan-binding protein n=1 Tax=Fodinicola acaciae TaxID=2681555 RepID=UPI0013D30DCA|nr:peptidoglycan-binding protein [Fodinicola acaciae]